MYKPKLQACMSCDSIVIKETRGFYNVDTNPYGWNTPNLERNFTGTAILTIKYNGTVTEQDVKTVIEDAIFPEFTLFTLDEPIKDGVYTFTLTLVDTDNNVTYTETIKKVSTCEVECCVNKLAVKAVDSCDCNTKEFTNFVQAVNLFYSLEEIAKCLGEAEFTKQLKKLQKICSTTDCGCGC